MKIKMEPNNCKHKVYNKKKCLKIIRNYPSNKKHVGRLDNNISNVSQLANANLETAT